ncbi:SDR family oxidoreductase [Streptomyces sp. NPDC096153]|uniref:SDR family oxidoreductase n=1 Tax=Streptomyces sp. NPDC096153 TaxID=3155548 RepID=UPI0033238CB0
MTRRSTERPGTGRHGLPEEIPAIAAKTALGRVGEPDDIGMVIATLLSEEGRWITAQNIEVAGGYGL